MAKIRFQVMITPLTLALLVTVAMVKATAGPASPPISAGFLRNCETKIALCGFEVYMSVFHGAPMSPNCCRSLVLMGKPCHDALVFQIISKPWFQGNKTLILECSNRTWNNCLAVAAPPARSS